MNPLGCLPNFPLRPWQLIRTDVSEASMVDGQPFVLVFAGYQNYLGSFFNCVPGYAVPSPGIPRNKSSMLFWHARAGTQESSGSRVFLVVKELPFGVDERTGSQ